MFTSSINIARAVTKLLKSGIEEKYQTSDTTGVVGWHNAMTVGQILTQLESNYGRPDPLAIQANETRWNAPHNPNDSPETLFHKMEQCQEVALLADNEYTEKQIVAKTVEHLKRSGIFPTKEYEDWGVLTPKTYVALKRHFYNAYTRRLDAIQNGITTGQQGYSNANQYNALGATTGGSDSDSTGGDMTETIIAAAMAASDAKMDSIMATNAQIMVQLAAMTVAPPAATTVVAPAYMAPAFSPPPMQYNPPPTNYYAPPVNHVNVPTTGGYYTQRGPRQGGGRNGGGGRGGRGRGPRTPFADYVARNNTQQIAPVYGGGTVATSVLTAGTAGQQQVMRPPNIVKIYNNWNMCYSCGFDVEDTHTSATCPLHWRKAGHQTGCDCNNYQQYIAQGWKPRMKGAHKTQLPTM